jgi:hypothetical protein
MSDEIVARFNLVRKSQGYGAAVRWDESHAYQYAAWTVGKDSLRTDVPLVPGVPTWFLAQLVDFEPLGSGTIELVTGRGVARGHICHAWTDLMWPLSEE